MVSKANILWLVGAAGFLLPALCLADSATFNPSLDGLVYRQANNQTFADIHNNAGTDSDDAGTTNEIDIQDGTNNSSYRTIIRAPIHFNTASLPDDATVTAVTLCLQGTAKSDNLSINPTFNVYTSTTSGESNLVTGDYNVSNWGTTPLATAITYSGWSGAGQNCFTFNSDGRAAINLTGVTAIGIREASYDAANSAFTTTNNSNIDTTSIVWDSEENSTSGNRPVLTVTYTVGGSPPPPPPPSSGTGALNSTGSLLSTNWVCTGYDLVSDGSGHLLSKVCNGGNTYLQIPAIKAFTGEAAYLSVAPWHMLARWALTFILLFFPARWMFRIITLRRPPKYRLYRR